MRLSVGIARWLGGQRLPRGAVVWLVCLIGAFPAAALGASGGAGTTGPSNTGTGRGGAASSSSSNPFAQRGMWIWYVSQSNGGSLSSIVSAAHRYGLGTLMIKSGDGTGAWSQFNSGLVSYLHSQGLKVCGWQYVYGTHPINEAEVGAAAKAAGADCLLIDAESEYEGKYVQAQEYIKKLRQLVGSSFPVGLASFPYVDYHPALPYSVFMGPGGAQYNVPQMYWPDIQTTVDAVYSHTFEFNLPYARPIEPLGEVAGDPPPGQVERFRQLSRAYGANNVSWWDWQECSTRDWTGLSRPVGTLSGFHPSTAPPVLSVRSQGGISSGDLVIWAQQHLYTAGYHISIDGGFGPQTAQAVRQFQSAHRITATGEIGSATWLALLRYAPVQVLWYTKGGQTVASAARDRGARGAVTMPAPASAHDRAKAYEIPPHLGRG